MEKLTKYKADKPLTKRERQMYSRLIEAFPQPEFIVLAQVSFQSFLTPREEGYASRNRIAKKYADFLICTLSFFVVAVVELDDWSHVGRSQEDAERDKMVKSAGILTVRYREIPDAKTVREEVMGKKAEMAKASKARKEAWLRRMGTSGRR